MRTQIHLSFNGGRRPWWRLQALFERAGCSNLVQGGPSIIGYYGVTLNADDPTLEHLREELQVEGIEWAERIEFVYTTQETRAAPLLWMRATRAPRGYGGPRHGTEYDRSSACPQCGTGAVQVSPLVLCAGDPPKRGGIFQTTSGEYLVSNEVAEAWRAANITGVELRQAVLAQSGALLPWWQLIATQQLPPMAITTKGLVRDDPCPQCYRDGYFHSLDESFQPAYSQTVVDIGALPDVTRTFEFFGQSKIAVPFAQSSLAQPALMIKPVVFDLFKRSKVRGLEFVPVTLRNGE